MVVHRRRALERIFYEELLPATKTGSRFRSRYPFP